MPHPGGSHGALPMCGSAQTTLVSGLLGWESTALSQPGGKLELSWDILQEMKPSFVEREPHKDLFLLQALWADVLLMPMVPLHCSRLGTNILQPSQAILQSSVFAIHSTLGHIHP